MAVYSYGGAARTQATMRRQRRSVAVRRGVRSVGEDGTVESLTRLREQRAFLCRLSADRALGSVEEADTFLQDRGLLTRTADCALPSLYEACHEDPYQPGSPGFATRPARKSPWAGELAGAATWSPPSTAAKHLLVTGEVARRNGGTDATRPRSRTSSPLACGRRLFQP